MSKVDGLRAMREARYERAQAAAKGATKPKKAASAKASPKAASSKAAPSRVVSDGSAPEAEEVEAAPELCGHRNMSGRTCTRESGHSAKNHRYS